MKNQTLGKLWILNSALFFGTYGIWSRLMGHNFGEFNQAWTRGAILLVFVLLIGLYKKLFKPIPKQDWKWFALIAFAGGLNQAPYYLGFQNLYVGTATLLFYAALIVGGYLIGKLLFNEKITMIKIVSLVLSLVGMSIIYKLSLKPGQIIPATLTIIAGFMGSISAVLPKKLSQNYHEFQIMTGYLIVMIITNGFLSIIFGETLPGLTNLQTWLPQLGYSCSFLVANFSVMEGFKRLEASIGSLIGMAEIIFSALFGYLLFHETLNSTTIIGGAIILIAATLPNLKTAAA